MGGVLTCVIFWRRRFWCGKFKARTTIIIRNSWPFQLLSAPTLVSVFSAAHLWWLRPLVGHPCRGFCSTSSISINRFHGLKCHCYQFVAGLCPLQPRQYSYCDARSSAPYF